jgi:DNA-binding CsgD family transcriptional regulator/predicted ester cyclase
MSTEANKALIRRYFEAINGAPKTRQLLDRFTTDADLIRHIEQAEAAFPSYRIELQETIAEGDLVSIRGTMHGVHSGHLRGIPPTGRELAWEVSMTCRISGGKIVQHWMLTDILYRVWRDDFSDEDVLAVSALAPHLRTISTAMAFLHDARIQQLRHTFAEAGLSPREKEVALRLCERLTVREMAEQLFVSQKTIAKHLEHIYSKLGLHGKRRVYEQLLGNYRIRPIWAALDSNQ